MRTRFTVLFLSMCATVIGYILWVSSSPKAKERHTAEQEFQKADDRLLVEQSDSHGADAVLTPATQIDPEAITSVVAEPTAQTVNLGEIPNLIPAEPMHPIRWLGANREVAEIYSYLQSSGLAPGQSLSSIRNRKHGMLNTLQSINPPPPGFADLLAGIFMDPTQDEVMRNYAVQHMGLYYPRASHEERRRVAAALNQALLEEQSGMAGTALLTLMHLSRDHAEIDSSTVGAHALELAMNDQCGPVSRMTALQVCAELNITEIVPTAEQLARTSGNAMLRRASISALQKLNRNDEEVVAGVNTLLKGGAVP